MTEVSKLEPEKEKFPWYEEVDAGMPLTQGDIIPNFIVPMVVTDIKPPFFSMIGAEFPVIVMTQACDLEQNKAKNISFCVLEPLSEFSKKLLLDEAEAVAKQNIPKGKEDEVKINREELINFSDLKNGKQKRINSIIKDLKAGRYVDFHLLNRNEIGENDTTSELDYYVVLLKQTYQMPIESARALIAYLVQEPGASKKRLRLSPPYREHLAQAYANTYSRIGLPIDIEPTIAQGIIVHNLKEEAIKQAEEQ